MGGIAVIIVNYNAADLAISAIESVLDKDHGGRAVEVHLVDNASPQADAQKLLAAAEARGWNDRVELYPEDENHGFGRGNNLVLRRLAERDVPPDYVFLLNPDAALSNEAIAALADFLDRHPKAAVAGARITKPGSGPVTAAFRFPSIIGEFSQALAFGPVARVLRKWRVPLSPDLDTSEVDWVAGAAMMGRLSALKEVGFFDPAYFLYYEEVDLMRRLKRVGWQTWYVAEAEVEHVEGASTDVKSGREERRRSPAYLYESWRIYYIKNHGRLGAIVAAAARILGAVLNRPIVTLRRRAPAGPLFFFRDFWAVGVRPLIGLKARSYE